MSESGDVARRVRRVALLSVHTSPLAQPGTGDAGGMNVSVLQTARALAAAGVEVDVFTRATAGDQAAEEAVPGVEGVVVHHVTAGPREPMAKDELPAHLDAFAARVQRIVAERPGRAVDVVHSHYWLSGQVGRVLADVWDVPLVHTMHTMARVKNAQLAPGDVPEPAVRVEGEAGIVDDAAALVANTPDEARQLVGLYGADPRRVHVVAPGVDLTLFTPDGPGVDDAEKAAWGVPAGVPVLLFVGRVQPLKAPDVAVRALAALAQRGVTPPPHLVVVGGPSGSGLAEPDWLGRLAEELGVAEHVTVRPPLPHTELARWLRAADLVLVPSHNESFGLVALEAEACGTPVVAAAVGGLPTAVGPGGRLVEGHDPRVWADVIGSLLADDTGRGALGTAAAHHAQGFGWEATAAALLRVYEEAQS